MLTSRLYQTQPRKTQVNARRINKEWMRRKLAAASFIPAPRLVKTFKLLKAQ